ncbi:hypothetical protein [Streptomyces sp. NPDC056192]|uniref:hypothetical protein n=1 Tax=Streptomyces sp. NPDC056192 TaxID=3345743 RepID=UPI0035DBEC5E
MQPVDGVGGPASGMRAVMEDAGGRVASATCGRPHLFVDALLVCREGRLPAELTHHPLSVGLLLGGAQPGGPLLLDTAELPHGQGSSPRGEEEADDEADGVQAVPMISATATDRP